MTNATLVNFDQHDLVISRLVHASRAKLWQAWADPHLLKEWWCPKPWTTEVLAFGEGTRYVATVMHPNKATRDRHEEMGFFQGWNTCIDQLEAFAQQSH